MDDDDDLDYDEDMDDDEELIDTEGDDNLYTERESDLYDMRIY